MITFLVLRISNALTKRICTFLSDHFWVLLFNHLYYYEKKAETQRFISISFHESKGTMGAKMMRDNCDNQGHSYSLSTIRKYMREMNLGSSIRRKKEIYNSQKQHLVFPNLIQQHFITSKPNQVWCVYFTYLYLANGTPRYNCTLLDVYDRRVVSSKKWLSH